MKEEMVIDFILKIREQDTIVYQTILAVFVGAALVSLLVVAVSKGFRKGDESSVRFFFRFACSLLAIILFVAFIYAAQGRQVKRKDFGIKWLGTHINSIEKQKPEALIKKYIDEYYALKETNTRFFWEFKAFPYMALVLLWIALYLRPREPVHQSNE